MMRQSLISDGFHEVQRRELNKAWAKFFYDANMPFAVAKNAAFKEAVMKTAAFKKPYVPPSYHDIRTTLLVQARADLEAQLDKRVAESVQKFGGTLAIDEWTSVNSRPLCNAMLMSPNGELFLGSVDTTGNEKTATYMASLMERFIEQVGPHNIVQVCTNNDRSMLRASPAWPREAALASWFTGSTKARAGPEGALACTVPPKSGPENIVNKHIP